MDFATLTSSSDRPDVGPRLGRTSGRVAALAAAAVIALAAAAPALADDDLTLASALPASSPAEPTETLLDVEPDPLLLPVPDVALPSTEELGVDEPPITVTVTEDDAGSIDVSVRVLSPDDDGSVGQQAAQPSVVSPSPAADITDEPTATPSSTDVSTDDHAIAPAAGSNVNVSIRVLSPGEDGAVDQIGAQDEGIDALPTAEALREPPVTDQADSGSVTSGADSDDPSTEENAEEYHDGDSRYQSDMQSDLESWRWAWYLTLDCDGNLRSASEETGAQSSLDWVWEWTWEWSCSSPPRPPPVDETVVEVAKELSVTTPSPVSDDTPAGTEEGSQGGREPWRWTWTFTFCGETVSATLPIATEAALAWQWDWIWSWACEAGASEPAASVPEVSTPSPSVQIPEPSGTTRGAGELGAGLVPAWLGPPLFDHMAFPTWLISLIPPGELVPIRPTELISLAKTFDAGTISVAVELEIPFSASPQLIPVGIATEDAPTILAPLVPAHPSERTGSTPPPDGGATRPSDPEARTSEASAGVKSSRPRHPGTATTANPGAGSASPRRAPLSPVGLPPRQVAGSSGASSSLLPSGSVVGTAALVALFILAAPTLGRRIRVAQELSPRGTYGSSIDRPG